MHPGDYLAHYASKFDTVKIDATFYRTPTQKMVDGWRDKTPPGFLFAAKVPQAITQEKVLVDCVEESRGAWSSPWIARDDEWSRMSTSEGPVLKTVESIVAGGIAGLVSAWIAYHFGTKRDLQHIREEFNHRLREQQDKQSIAVEDETWRKHQDAKEAVGVVYAGIRSTPDLDRKSPDELEEFLKNTILSPMQQHEIRRATRKTELLSEFIRWKELFDASTMAFAARDYVVREKLYLSPELASDFLTCAKHLLDAVNDRHTWHQMPSGSEKRSIHEEGARSLDAAAKLLVVIEAKIRKRREKP